MNARIYDPNNGRFLSADTIVPDPNNWDSYNRYMYVRGNPMKYRDPSGHTEVVLDPVTVHGTPSYVPDDLTTNVNLLNTTNQFAQSQINSNISASPTSTKTWSSTTVVTVRGNSGTISSSSSTMTQNEMNEVGFWNNPGAYLPQIPADVVNFSAGLGDALLFGFGDELREVLDIDGVNRNSTHYAVGEGVSIALGGLGTYRAIYSGGFKLASMSSDGVVIAASRLRNVVKRWGGPAALNPVERAKIVPVSQRLTTQGIDGIRASLGTTRGNYNALIALSPGIGGLFNE